MKAPLVQAGAGKGAPREWFSTFAVDNIVHKRLKKRLNPGGDGKDIKLSIFWTIDNEFFRFNEL